MAMYKITLHPSEQLKRLMFLYLSQLDLILLHKSLCVIYFFILKIFALHLIALLSPGYIVRFYNSKYRLFGYLQVSQPCKKSKVWLTYNFILVSGVQHSHFYIHILCNVITVSIVTISTWKDITIILAMFPMLYITSLWLICFKTGSFCHLLPFTF